MCGIVAYIGDDKAGPILFDTLKRLEYRGYDSAGVAVISQGSVEVLKSSGRIVDLEKTYKSMGSPGEGMGIGHTRWATHGRPSDINAHPHTSGEIAIVHNGIIENYLDLRELLTEMGYEFQSETDSEVLAHLIHFYYKGDLCAATLKALEKVEGSYAIAVMAASSPYIVCARYESPLVIGKGSSSVFVASDVPALLPYTKDIIRLKDGNIARIYADRIEVMDCSGAPLESEVERITWDTDAAEKGGYPHFMLKEIHEQPRAIRETIAGRISEIDGDVRLSLGISEEEIMSLERVTIIACGTSYHAGMLARNLFVRAAGLPVDVEVASEFLSLQLRPRTLLVGITQSGETADTLLALKKAKTCGGRSLAITNVVGSTVTELVDGTIFTRCGPEIGVAATKTFTSQMVAVILLAIRLGRARGHLTPDQARKMLIELTKLPGLVQRVLEKREEIRKIAEMFAGASCYFFIGRDYLYPISLEGALKMKEIAYIPSEGYAGGELKHGPLALITEKTPVVALATCGKKIQSNIKEVRARGAEVIALATEGDPDIAKVASKVIELPETRPIYSAVLCTVAVQLLAYYTANKLGLPIDKPRNLAKCVTVE
ncbi:glutamine--fructose-6-phosphate transaminase (isomerizing) [Methanothrix soehngenii]|jgi:glucosamine--fructose-6-phosphate aminotransferase (isomerizing)|uniref:Glutamine--fructose-6-phosphate aminotransferase [isomerizing] n=1 Tax=Methanothrix soehngenii (strain ATCC 5969 / DSM 3671 / JCM 10134 / NBRC 103675 / OCM 69 / GP-6) TaxID=990316 RepID=F4BZD2_METSG|nr:glutamine--fructose-6-phosphate transaminase (isomerizing) [Methanothrix soehngenii]AEB69002.1 Glucosamine-6-phosphate synthase [Methanothrix soehngenii GP6]MCK9585254.1 glutamine--fructose-6-phosphate transaminase (isomerizing) [Methanothrix soehngenii]MDD5256481.1 glutamine--fructose-6-phosphate transaminase (isomerizing) [Methanothrix soehngenii]MDD5734054.1 glutamine--fructose-6-phosphate transaminase (isomerizing) [Methanothrix soehngenii]